MQTNRVLPITLILTATSVILIALLVLAFRAFGGGTPAKLDADGYPIGQPVTLAQLDAHAMAHLTYPGVT